MCMPISPFPRKEVWVCPNCGETKVTVSMANPPGIFPGWIWELFKKMLPPVCPRCKTKMVKKATLRF